MKAIDVRPQLEHHPVTASAPCRIDMGGTLDIPSLHLTLPLAQPMTFNIAVAMRTRVRLEPWQADRIRISARGVGEAEFGAQEAPFDHALGLMFAVATHFGVAGIHIRIDSESPPRSALGGSSVAAVALIKALDSIGHQPHQKPLTRRQIALLGQQIESAVAGVPCGFQDQLAAAFGGVNAWYWPDCGHRTPYRRLRLVKKAHAAQFARHLLLAYCGQPHVSKDINGRWLRQYKRGQSRRQWQKLARLSAAFIAAMRKADIGRAVAVMHQELEIRRSLTPDVLDAVGTQLIDAASDQGCGARFCGAGGGGCVWALGSQRDIEILRHRWQYLLTRHKDAEVLPVRIDFQGVRLDPSNGAGDGQPKYA